MEQGLVSTEAPNIETKGGNNNQQRDVVTSFFYTKAFEECLPYYMAIGMSLHEYWEEDCKLTEYYRKAFELRNQMRNQELWLQGMYIYEAILDCSPILHPFAGKNAKPIEYSKEPYPITKEEMEERQEREAKAKVEKIKQALNRFSKNKGG